MVTEGRGFKAPRTPESPESESLETELRRNRESFRMDENVETEHAV